MAAKYEAKKFEALNKALAGISQKTIETHRDKLYVGYVNKKNEIEEKLEKVDRATANATYGDFRSLKLEETFAANGVFLHEYYFYMLEGDGIHTKAPELLSRIIKDFGSFEKWIEDFKACGMSARGWVVLVWDTNDGRLHNYIGDMHNQGGIWGALPIVVLDVYEHAYFMDYGSDRKSYVEVFMKLIDWAGAEKLYKRAVQVQPMAL